MLTITRSLAQRLRTVFRLALGIGGKSPPHLRFASSRSGLTVRCQNAQAAVEYHQSGHGDKAEMSVPFQLLGDVAGSGDAPVTIRLEQGQVIAEFHHCGEMKRAEYPVPKDDEHPQLSAVPRKRSQQSSRLLSALTAAAQVTDGHNHRYALRNVCLQGDHGRIVATDGRQLTAHNGFTFPWKGDVLVPANKVFGCKPWQDVDVIEVGTSKTHFFVMAGPWRLWLPTDKEGRFPRVDDVIPSSDRVSTTIVIADEDAAFVLEQSKQLPADDKSCPSVTIEAGEKIAIRAAGDRQSGPVELELTNSQCTGQTIRCNTDRRYLLHALAQGYRQLQLTGAEQPILCRKEERLYLWAALGGGDAIPAGKDAKRLSSPALAPANTTPSPTTNGRSTLAKNTPTNSNGSSNGHAATPNNNGVDALIEQAEAVRGTLRDATKDIGDLITALKAHRKQTKLVRSTLASLRQLQAIDA